MIKGIEHTCTNNECGKKFYSSRIRAKFCSKTCAKRVWYLEHIEQKKAYDKARYIRLKW